MQKFLPRKRVISVAATILILAVLIAHTNINHVYNNLANMDGLLALAAFVMFILQTVFLSVRWHVLVNLNHHYIPRHKNDPIFYASNLVNFLFLSSISGPIIRLILAIRAGSPWLNATCATLIDRLFSIGTMIGMGILVLPLAVHIVTAVNLTDAYIIFASITCATAFGAGILLFLYSAMIKTMMGPRLFRVVRAYGLRLLDSWSLMLVTFLSVMAQGSFFVGVYFILAALHIPISFLTMISILPVLLPILAVLMSLPISVGGWGVREGGYVLALGLVGVTLDQAFLTSMMVGALTMLSAVMLAIPALSRGVNLLVIPHDFKPYQRALAYMRSQRS